MAGTTASLAQPRSTTSIRPLDLLVGLAIFGTAFQAVQFGGGLSIADPVIGLAMLAAIPYLLTVNNPGRRLLVVALPWIWVFVIGELLGLMGVGITGWAANALLRNLGAFTAFFAFLAICAVRPAARVVGWIAFYGAFALVAMSVLVYSPPGLRATGVFDNANYPGHFLAAGVTVLIFMRSWNRLLRALGILVGVVGIIATGSFGAVAFLVAVAAYWAWSRGAMLPRDARMAVRLLAVVTVGVVMLLGATNVSVSDVNAGINPARFTRSSSAREQLWSEAISVALAHPLGVGPGGFAARHDLGKPNQFLVHNDYLEILVDGGLLGLIGFAGLIIALWRATRTATAARALLLGFGTAAIFRDTINFRHLWLVLALAVASGALQRKRSGATAWADDPNDTGQMRAVES